MNFAPSRFIVYTNEEVSSEILSTGSRLTAPAAGKTPTLPEASASPLLTSGRFSVTIGGMRPELGGQTDDVAGWTISINRCHITVSGLSTDEDVLFYSTDGILRHRAPAFLGTCEAELTPGVYVVKAEGKSNVIGLMTR